MNYVINQTSTPIGNCASVEYFVVVEVSVVE
jgi:hypothetical protein